MQLSHMFRSICVKLSMKCTWLHSYNRLTIPTFGTSQISFSNYFIWLDIINPKIHSILFIQKRIMKFNVRYWRQYQFAIAVSLNIPADSVSFKNKKCLYSLCINFSLDRKHFSETRLVCSVCINSSNILLRLIHIPMFKLNKKTLWPCSSHKIENGYRYCFKETTTGPNSRK